MIRLLLLVLLVLVVVLVTRTFTAGEDAGYQGEPSGPAAGGPIVLDDDRVLERLSRAVTFRTVSPQPPEPRDEAAFTAFLDWLEQAYPRVFANLEAERIGGLTLLLSWAGTDSTAAPVLLAGHYDVVPVTPGSEQDWQHPPFAGTVADGYLWGRGALDNKNGVIGLLEAVDWMLEQGEQPRRTVYFSFGHDEEIGGEHGARAVVDTLERRGVRLAWTLDEGSFVFENMFPGVEQPIALINTAEKGNVTVRIVASAAGGHSSMPPRHTAVGRLAEALVALERNPVPGGLDGLPAQTFDAVAPHMPFLPRLMFANRWLFGPLVEAQLEDLAFANAMMRTTTAPTMLSGSPKENVLPAEVSAVVNFRVHPRDTVESVVQHVRSLVENEHVHVEALPGNPASGVADAQGEGFRAVADAVRAEFGELLVAPGLLVAATDSRHYARIAEDAYRFNPMVVTEAELDGFHGTNERIPVAGMLQGVRSYVRLLRRL